MDELKQKIEELEKTINDMKGGYSFPAQISSALSAKLFGQDALISDITRIGGAAASFTRSATDSGGDTVTVLAYPDGFIIFNKKGEQVYIPYWKTS